MSKSGITTHEATKKLVMTSAIASRGLIVKLSRSKRHV